MKKLMILSVILCIAWGAYGQTGTQAGETVTVNGFTLNRVVGKYTTQIESPQDKKLNLPYMYVNGQLAPQPGRYPTGELSVSSFHEAVKKTFTATELARYRGTSVTMCLIFDTSGTLIEVGFIIDTDLPLAHIPLEKYVLWTRNLKRYVRVPITDPQTKKLQFVRSAVFYKMP